MGRERERERKKERDREIWRERESAREKIWLNCDGNIDTEMDTHSHI